MQEKKASPPLLQQVLAWLLGKACACRIPLLSGLVFGLLAHGFAFTNKLVNHDEVTCLFSKGATVISGRWGLGFLDTIFPNVSMPWIYGIITITLLSCSVCILVSLLKIRNPLLQALAAGLVLTFPSLTGTFGYMFTASSYGIAFLLAVLAVWCLKKNKPVFIALSLVCMVGSLSIYQSYLSLTAAVLILVLIQELIENADAAAVFRRGLLYVGFLLLSLALYWIATQLILKLKHVSMGDYASSSITFDLASLPANILLAYRSFFEAFRETSLALMPQAVCRIFSLLLLLCGGFSLFSCIQKKPASLLLLVFLLTVLPLAINCMYLITSPESIHTLVLYGFISLYLLVLVIFDAIWEKPILFRQIVLNAGILAAAAVIVSNTYTANQAYLNLHLRYENAHAFYAGLVANLQKTPEFTEDTHLAVLGTWQDPSIYSRELELSNHLTGTTGFKPDSYSYGDFLNYYIGVHIPIATEEEIQAIENTPEYAQMPCYPYYGSIRKIGDVVVVKLSD